MEGSVVKKRPPLPLPKPKIDRSRILNPSSSCGGFNDTSCGRSATVRTKPDRPPLPKNYPSQPMRRSQSCLSNQPSVALDSGEMPGEEIVPVPPPRRRRRNRSEPTQEQVSPSHPPLPRRDSSHCSHSSPAEWNTAPELPPRSASIQHKQHPSPPVHSHSDTMTIPTAGTGASPNHVHQQKPRSYTASLPKSTSAKGFGSASLPRVATYKLNDTATMPVSKSRTCSFGTVVHQSVMSKQAQSAACAVVRHMDFEQAGFKAPLEPPPAMESSLDLYEPVNPRDSYGEEEEEVVPGTYEPIKQYDDENQYEGENECREEPHNHASMRKSGVAIRTRLLGQPTPFLGMHIPRLGKKTPAKTTPSLGQANAALERPTSPKSPRSSSPPPSLPPRNAPLPSHTATPPLPPRITPQSSHDPIPPLPPRNPGAAIHGKTKRTRPQSGLPPLPSQPVLLPHPPLEKLELREEDERCDSEYMDMDDKDQDEEYVVPHIDPPKQCTPSPNLLPDETGTYELVDTQRPVPPPRRDSKLMFGHLSVPNKNQSPVGSSGYVMLHKAT